MGIVVNMSSQEASATTLEPFPAGWYPMTITECELVESKSPKNNGKPMYKIELTVLEGDFEGRKVHTNACLWDGALYTISQILKALELYDGTPGQMEIPDPEELSGQDLLVKVKIQGKRVVDGKEYDARNEFAGAKSLKAGAPNDTAQALRSSLLP
jgi:hypothetical protein